MKLETATHLKNRMFTLKYPSTCPGSSVS
uniref:Uncharacterized protein n=1 Tax=Anguilla anguilla TaxID=7936 RepID=A0A0E9XJ56_ANGAN